MLATWITLARFPLLPVILLSLLAGSPAMRWAGVGLLLVGLLLDTVDGVVARRRGETSLTGSVLDIAADRAYELVLYVWFAWSGLIPVAIPLIVTLRTTLTDAIRSLGVREGCSPFAQARPGLARFLVASSWTRIGYGTSKFLTFAALGVVQAAGGPAASTLGPITGRSIQVLAWTSVGFCLLRGIPVIVGWLLRGGASGRQEA